MNVAKNVLFHSKIADAFKDRKKENKHHLSGQEAILYVLYNTNNEKDKGHLATKNRVELSSRSYILQNVLLNTSANK